ncbi:MAG: xanthine dehydrogenase [Lachnospiraceae bacterium]|nr:xanthine dehydrogenase [Lachnospiraceae bacterium]
MMDGKIRAVRSSGAGMYHGLHKHDMNEEAKESISGSDFFNEKHAEEIWKAHLADKHRITIEKQEIFLHSIGNRARLVICGGGHVSTALVRMAKLLDFEIWVLEDRPFFAEHAKQEGADHILCGDYVESLAKIPKDVDNYYVCMTRGHRFDLECLKEIYKKTFAYAGMMGSRKRSVLVRKDLEEAGYTKEQVQKLHSPIGLAIGAQTPAEIALSVISEIVQCKNERAKAAETDEAILEELTEPQRLSKFAVNDENEMEYRMLCTIIEKRGSAPRSIGTQMLVTSDNRIIGTIGGGCAEAEVITRCRGYFAEMRKGIHGICEIVKIQMSTDNVEEEGMVCGGRIEVLLEET